MKDLLIWLLLTVSGAGLSILILYLVDWDLRFSALVALVVFASLAAALEFTGG